VLVTNPLAPEYLKKRLDGLIVSSLEQVLGYPVQVEFVVAEETT
jgi:hypothetical protein